MPSENQLRLLAVGDLHGRLDVVARIVALHRHRPPDAVILPGDLSPDFAIAESNDTVHTSLRRLVLDAMVRTFATLGCPILAVPGNHDLPDLDGVQGLTNLDLTNARLGGFTMLGIGGAPRGPWSSSYQWTESELAARLDGAAIAAPTIVVSHTPPFNPALGLTSGEEAWLASRTVAAFVAQHPGIRLCISGHLHRRAGVFRIGEAAVVCCGGAAPDRAVAPMWPGKPGSSDGTDGAPRMLEQHFVIEVGDEAIRVWHHRLCPKSMEALPVEAIECRRAAGAELVANA
jgi:Icc-related predicted phosphoesterase